MDLLDVPILINILSKAYNPYDYRLVNKTFRDIIDRYILNNISIVLRLSELIEILRKHDKSIFHLV